MDQNGHPTVAFSSVTRAAFRSATRSMGLRPHRTTQSFASIEFLLDREPLVSLIEYRHAKR